MKNSIKTIGYRRQMLKKVRFIYVAGSFFRKENEGYLLETAAGRLLVTVFRCLQAPDVQPLAL